MPKYHKWFLDTLNVFAMQYCHWYANATTTYMQMLMLIYKFYCYVSLLSSNYYLYSRRMYTFTSSSDNPCFRVFKCSRRCFSFFHTVSDLQFSTGHFRGLNFALLGSGRVFAVAASSLECCFRRWEFIEAGVWKIALLVQPGMPHVVGV